MATRTKPFVTAATLASAAAIAVATPAIAPSLSLPTPNALSAAKVQLATFADVLTVPTVEWTDLLFGNTSWGGVLSATNYGAEAAKPQDLFLQPGYVNPWAPFCAGECTSSGISGVAYLFLDALVNGNGQGYDNVDQWSTGIVNYLFEPSAVFVLGGGSSPYLQYVQAGFSAAAWYALQTTVGAAIPALTVPLAAAFWGPNNVSVAYNAILTGVAQVLSLVPGVGPFAGNSILAYLGDLEIPDSGGLYYQYGLSGALNYWIDIATGAVPFPSASTRAAAATLAAATTAAAPAAAATTVAEAETPAVVSDTKPAADAPASTPAAEAPESTPAAEAPESTPAAEAPESTPATDAESTESTPAADTESTESTPAADTESTESTPATDTESTESTPAVDAPESTPAVTDTKPAVSGRGGPAKTAPKHPVRDAVEKVSKQINSAINGAKAAKAAKADAAS